MLAGMPGWALQVVKHLNDASVDTAQVWKPTGEPYFCRSRADPNAGALGPFGFTAPDKLAASYKGEESFQGQGVSKFLVKHKEMEHVEVEYLAKNIGRTDTEVLFAPVMFKVTVGAGKPDARVIAYVLDKFKPVSSILPDVFRWYQESGLTTTQSAPFNSSACKTTLPYTSTNVVPTAATIYGTSPFTPMGSSPLATDFYWDLQNDPTLTAAAWAANKRLEEDSRPPSAPSASPEPPLAPSTSDGRRLREQINPVRSNAKTPPALISTALKGESNLGFHGRALGYKYCSDCILIGGSFDILSSKPGFEPGFKPTVVPVCSRDQFTAIDLQSIGAPAKPPPSEDEISFGCSVHFSYPLQCAGRIACNVALKPAAGLGFVTLKMGGSVDWDFGMIDGNFGFKAQGCLSAGVTVGVPNCWWCPTLAAAKVKVCLSGDSMPCADAEGGRFTELIFTAGVKVWVLVVGASLELKIFKYPGADPAWCPEERANRVNGGNHELTVEGAIYICFIWCWDIYNGHLIPSYSNDALMRDRRNNGYGAACWNKGQTRCRNGICDICENSTGSCCRSNFNDWTPECSGHGPRHHHRCGDSNYLCLERCATNNSDGSYSRSPERAHEACMRSNSDVC